MKILPAVLVIGMGAGLSWAAPASKDQLQIASIQGTGEVKVCRGSECSAAKAGQVLEVGETIQVASNAKAILRAGKDTFELRANSKLLVDRVGKRDSKLNLQLGTLKAKVMGSLFGRKSVSVVTPVNVMAVRGTEFICTVSEGGDVRLEVLYGRVDFINVESGKREDSFIQGE